MFNQNYMPRQYPQQMYQPNYNYTPTYQQTGIQGRVVDNVDVVRATEISLDGSINYFPLADGSAILTKQLQMDGTSKIVMYKPVENAMPRQLTTDDLNTELMNLKEQMEEMKNKLTKLEGVEPNDKS